MTANGFKHSVSFKITPEQKRILQDKAIQAGYKSRRSGRPKIATYIYDRIVRYDDVIYRLEGIAELMEFYRVQKQVDNNINQVVRTVNRINALNRREKGQHAVPEINASRMDEFNEFLNDHNQIREKHYEILELILHELRQIRERHEIQL